MNLLNNNEKPGGFVMMRVIRDYLLIGVVICLLGEEDVRVHAAVAQPNNTHVRARSMGKGRRSSLKQLVVSVLRGGHYDLTNHYVRPPPPPPPPDDNRMDTPIQYNTPTWQTSYPQHYNTPPAPPNAYLFPPGTWERYLRATKNDTLEAQIRLTATLQWRVQNGMDGILLSPHPHFDTLKRCYPHAYHLRGYNNEPVYYESPGKIDLTALKSAGLTLNDLLRHYALVTEFLWTYISPHQDGPGSKGITIIDLEGMRLRDFAGDVVTFVKRAAAFTGLHYPERSTTIYILNAPSFFQLLWRRVIAPLVDPVTLKKVRVVNSNTPEIPNAIRDALMQTIPIENIPTEYGGKSEIPLGYSPEELSLRELMDQNNLQHHNYGQSYNAFDNNAAR